MLARVLTLFVLSVAACDEVEPEVPPQQAPPQQAPPQQAPPQQGPARAVVSEPTSLSPSSYVTRHTELPEEVRCPLNHICVAEHDSKVCISKVGWRHHYRFDSGGADAQERFAAGVDYVLAEEGASGALGHCSVAALMPELYQVEGHGLVVNVPASASEPASMRPQPVPPVVANAHLRSEYAFIDIERAESMAWFTDAEVQAMTGSTFEEPRVRHANGRRLVDGFYRSLDLLIVYSPESQDVYVLERTRELPVDEHRTQHEELRRADEQALVDFVLGLGIRRVSFEVEAACEIPTEFGGREWMPLRSR